MSGFNARVIRSLRRVFGDDSAVERAFRDAGRRNRQRIHEGTDTRIEKKARLLAARIRGRSERRFSGSNYTVMWNGPLTGERRVGLYAKGSCDLPAMFAAAPDLQDSIDGVCGLFFQPGGVATARSDILVQSLHDMDRSAAEMLARELSLPDGYFEPNLFDPEFEIPGYGELGPFPKSAVILSAAADVARTVYRHRDSGLLVDPGGWWLNQDMSFVLANLDKVNWFRESFDELGRITVEEFYESFSEVIRALQEKTTKNILVMNQLEIEPGDRTHTYQLVWSPGSERRRAFNLALTEMSRELGFAIIDVDRILKTTGVVDQVDFAHFTNEAFRPIAQEIGRVLQSQGVFSKGEVAAGSALVDTPV